MIDKRTSTFIKWFDNLAEEARSVVITYIDRVKQGNTSNCKPVGEGVSEIKINFQKGYRVFYTMSKGIIIILLAGSDKSGNQKKQKSDIKRAKEIKKILKEKGEI